MTFCATVASATVVRVAWACFCTSGQMKFQTHFVKWFGLPQCSETYHLLHIECACSDRVIHNFIETFIWLLFVQFSKACSPSSHHGGRCHCGHKLSHAKGVVDLGNGANVCQFLGVRNIYERSFPLYTTDARCIGSCFAALNHDWIDHVLLLIMQLHDISSAIQLQSHQVIWQIMLYWFEPWLNWFCYAVNYAVEWHQ